MPYLKNQAWPPQHSESHRIRPGQIWRSPTGNIEARVVEHRPDLGQTFAYLEMGFQHTMRPGPDRFLGVQIEWPADNPTQSVVHEIEEFLSRYTLVDEEDEGEILNEWIPQSGKSRPVWTTRSLEKAVLTALGDKDHSTEELVILVKETSPSITSRQVTMTVLRLVSEKKLKRVQGRRVKRNF